MPLYEYECPKCGTFELIRKFSDAPLVECPTCGATIEKLQSAPAFQFKGTGWYITDYARKGKGGGEKAGGGEAKTSAGEGGKKSEGSGSESKSGSDSSASATESKTSAATAAKKGDSTKA